MRTGSLYIKVRANPETVNNMKKSLSLVLVRIELIRALIKKK